MKFQDVCGQRSIINKLIQNVQKGRIAHALMFTGDEGTGTLAIALAYAQFLNCTNRIYYQNPLQEIIGDSCGTCPSCSKIQKLIHPDLHFALPLNETKSGKKLTTIDVMPQWRQFIQTYSPYASLQAWYDFLEMKKQGIISAEECNNIINTLQYKTFEAEYKIMIIWMIEKLYPTAAPKLLKILEEPPDKTVFLLISANPEQVIDTIRSRAQIIQLLQIKTNEAAEYISTHYNLNKEQAVRIADQYHNNLSEIIEFLKNKDTRETWMPLFIDWMRVCYRQNTQLIADFTEKLKQITPEQLKLFLDFCTSQIRNAWIFHLNPSLRKGYHHDYQEFYEKFSKFIHQNNVELLCSHFHKAIQDIERNANTTILLIDLSFQIAFTLRIPQKD